MIFKLGITRVEEMKQLNANKLHQDLCGQNKKLKLGLANPSQDEVKNWLN